MSRNATVEIDVYEDDSNYPEKKIKVKSHWNNGQFIHLIVRGIDVVIARGDLEDAIKACTWTRY